VTLTADVRTQRGLGNSSSVAEMDRVPEEQGLNVASASPCEIILHFVLDFFFSLSQGSSVGASGCDPYSHMLLLGVGEHKRSLQWAVLALGGRALW